MTALLAFILPRWKWIVGGLAIGLVALTIVILRADVQHYKKLLTAEKSAHALDVANFRSAMATAKATNVETVRAVETDTSKITEDKQHDLETQLASARAAADDYARRLRTEASANKGAAGQGDLSQTAGTSGGIVGTGSVPVMDDGDLQICSVNTVKAKGWQDWYGQVRARYDTLTQ